MKSTEDASCGCSSQMFQISPVVTGALLTDPLMRWISFISR